MQQYPASVSSKFAATSQRDRMPQNCAILDYSSSGQQQDLQQCQLSWSGCLAICLNLITTNSLSAMLTCSGIDMDKKGGKLQKKRLHHWSQIWQYFIKWFQFTLGIKTGIILILTKLFFYLEKKKVYPNLFVSSLLCII